MFSKACDLEGADDAFRFISDIIFIHRQADTLFWKGKFELARESAKTANSLAGLTDCPSLALANFHLGFLEQSASYFSYMTKENMYDG